LEEDQLQTTLMKSLAIEHEGLMIAFPIPTNGKDGDDSV
jgi:hypothetical protein